MNNFLKLLKEFGHTGPAGKQDDDEEVFDFAGGGDEEEPDEEEPDEEEPEEDESGWHETTDKKTLRYNLENGDVLMLGVQMFQNNRRVIWKVTEFSGKDTERDDFALFKDAKSFIKKHWKEIDVPDELEDEILLSAKS